MNTIYRFTIYKSDSFGNGAEKRTAQISEILNEAGREWHQIPSGFNTITLSTYYFKKCFRTIINFLRVICIIKKPANIRSLYRTISYVTQFKGIYSIPKAREGDFILWETTKMEYSFVVPFFKKLGYTVVAIPHNIESLVPGQVSAITKKASPYWLFDEINILKECSAVFVISKEETLILRQCGIKAEYLPYYPTREVLDMLLRIRSLRMKREVEEKTKKRILMIGSAVNPPTKQGMKDRIAYFKKEDSSICDILVAGYGTESLKSLAENIPNLSFLGEISDDALFQIFTEIDAILIQQPPTSGALTRIIESLIAGVPVLVNFDGARNYFDMNGVHLYYNDEHLLELIAGDFETPVCPIYPMKEVESLKKIIN
jgi:hypothetical protein